MEFQNFILDRFQEESIASVERNNSVLVSAPTGSGKTLIADYIIDKNLKEDLRIIYTAPIKALSNQKFKDFTEQYGEDKIGLITGDIVINPTAPVLIMTTEVYRNMAIVTDSILDTVSYCIMDEVHYISDEERGYIWEESIIFSPDHVRFLFLSATIPNADEFARWVESIKHHTVDVVKHHVRPVPLERKFYDPDLGITTLEKIRAHKELENYQRHKKSRRRHMRGRTPQPDFSYLIRELKNKEKLPCIYFVFSRAKTQDYAVTLSKKQNFLNLEEQRRVIAEAGSEFRKLSPDVLGLKSTHHIRQCIPRGIAFHNAGMLPDIKHIVEKLFADGLIKVLFATETFAVGINMPAKTVCFDSLWKYAGSGFRYLNSKEYFQISGRAGRRGIDKKGLSVSVINRQSAEFDKIAEFTSRDVLPLKSQFKLTYNTVLNMVNLHTPEENQQILTMNFYTFQRLKGVANRRVLGSIKARYTKLFRTLTKLGYIKDGMLTRIGLFSTRIFSNEIEVSQIFMGRLDYELDEYPILLLVASLVYEGRRGTRFFKKYNHKKTAQIMNVVSNHPVLKSGKWYKNMENMTAIVDPCFQYTAFIDILKNTNMTEGDLIRLFMRMLDTLDQVDKALEDDEMLRDKVKNCKYLIKTSLEGIHVF